MNLIIDLVEPLVPLGKSQAAAQLAVTQTAFSRTLFAVPIMFPAFILYGMERMRLMPKAFGPLTTLQLSLFFMKLSIAVPLGTAFYP